MDFILETADNYVLDGLWARVLPLTANATEPATYWDMASNTTTTLSAWPRSYVPRQLISITALTLLGSYMLYFTFAWLSYTFIFNHDMMRHPRFLKNQVRQEIMCSVSAMPGMMALTLPWFEAEVLGYSRLYNGLDTYGYFYLVASVPLFLFFTDYCIYWIHRWLHVPAVYKALHKPHHKWISMSLSISYVPYSRVLPVPTPFASHAFHPADGYCQSLPYHLFVFIFPMHRFLYLFMFVLVNFWAIFIHDSDMITGHPLESVINGPAHHTLHHIYFTVNYGQYFTWADKVGNSYRQPEKHLDPLLEVQMMKGKEE
ncbi:fatty acid hydroxylase [Mucidula mucida]|nr:fatty acid hydroxylase [Mucidula mucida]